MAYTRYQLLLAVSMVVTGSINTLSTKWADQIYSVGSDGKSRRFNHPFVQACVMFLGEILCLLAFKVLFRYYTSRQVIVEDVDVIRGNQNFNPLIFLPPALLDMTATSLMYLGLTLTFASSFQMLRGSVIVFTAILSIIFVRRTMKYYHWAGIVAIIFGLVVVGCADFGSGGGKDTNSVITGDLLIIIAQILTACQMVYEEKFVTDSDIPPLQVVGWEGVFGFTIMSFLLLPFYFIHAGEPFANNAHSVLEDLPDALAQIANNWELVLALLGNMISIAFFNFAGIGMTKETSATTRMVLDTVRTFFIWMFCLALRWQPFDYLQLLGFFILLVGMCIYYNLIPRVNFAEFLRRNPVEEPIINQRADEP